MVQPAKQKVKGSGAKRKVGEHQAWRVLWFPKSICRQSQASYGNMCDQSGLIELDISRSAAGPCILERFQRKFSEIFLLPGGAVIDIPNDDAGHGAHGYGGRNANIAAKIVETFEQPDTHALLECIPIVAGRGRTPATRHDQTIPLKGDAGSST
jgi:hypothetical protein